MQRRDFLASAALVLAACQRNPVAPSTGDRAADGPLGGSGPALGAVIHTNAFDLSTLQATGVRYARVTRYVQDGPASLAGFGAKLAALDALGIEPLIVVHDFPSPASVYEHMRELVAMFPNRTWQVGNEWDAGESMTWTDEPMRGGTYARLMAPLVLAFRNARFVGMGLGGSTPGWFLRDYLVEGGLPLTAFGLHAYDGGERDRVGESLMALNGQGILWLTEFGARTASEQLTALSSVRNLRAVDRAYAYAVQSSDGFTLAPATIAAMRSGA